MIKGAKGTYTCTHCGHSEALHGGSCIGEVRRDDLMPAHIRDDLTPADIKKGWWIFCNCIGFEHLEYDMPLAPSAQELYEQMRRLDP